MLILTFAFGFNGLQAYNIASSLEHYAGDNYATAAMVTGVVLAAISAFLFFGGAHKISVVSSVIVPVMAAVYILIGLIITLRILGRFLLFSADFQRSL